MAEFWIVLVVMEVTDQGFEKELNELSYLDSEVLQKDDKIQDWKEESKLIQKLLINEANKMIWKKNLEQCFLSRW